MSLLFEKSSNLAFHFLVALAVIGCLLPTARAQFVQQGGKLVGTGAVGSANQGVSVALSGDGNTAIVGGYTDRSNTGSGVGIHAVGRHMEPAGFQTELRFLLDSRTSGPFCGAIR